MIIDENSHFTLELYESPVLHLVSEWKGLITAELYKEKIDLILRNCFEYDVNRIIFDQRYISSIPKGAYEYYKIQMKEYAKLNGCMYRAIIIKANSFVSIVIDNHEDGQTYEAVQFFSNQLDAVEWFENCENETH
ncbi:MAG: hypothetical protein RLO12_19470 [Fulvivirga sp.]